MDGTGRLLRGLAYLFFLTAAAELFATSFTSIGIAGFFAASFGVFWGGALLAMSRGLAELTAIRKLLTPPPPSHHD